MTTDFNKIKRVPDLLALSFQDEPNAWELLRAYVKKERIHVDDLGIGGVGGAGGVGSAGGVGGAGGGGESDAFKGHEEDYIHRWLRSAEVRCAYDHTLTWGRDAVDPEDPLSRVGRQSLTLRRVVRALTVEAARDDVKFPSRLINAVLADWMDEQRTAYVREVFKRIDHLRPPYTTEEASGRRILQNVCAVRFDEDSEYAAALILTVIHQIKRKLLGLPVDHHLVLSIRSRGGGTGKSRLAQAIFSPLQALAANSTLDEVLDERNVAIWARYAINLDDVDESAAKRKGQFRRRISQDTWVSRVLGSGDVRSVVNNATIVMSTHHRIHEIMPDTFSMRRFAELFGRETPPDAQAIRAVDEADWDAVWRSVDPEGPRPVDRLGFGPTLRARQEEARVRSPVEMWLDGFDMADPCYARHADANGWIRSGDLYNHCYMPNLEADFPAEKPLSKDGFAKELGALLAARGTRASLEKRKGRGTTEYRVRELSDEGTAAPTPATPPTAMLLLPRPDVTRH